MKEEQNINDMCRKQKEKLHYTIHQIAEGTNIPEDTIAKFFGPAPAKAPSINTVWPICSFLGISLDDFYNIPLDKDPRAEEMNAKLNQEINHLTEQMRLKDEHIRRLQSLLDEKDKLLRKGHMISSRIVMVCLLVILFLIAYGIALDYFGPLVGIIRGG